MEMTQAANGLAALEAQLRQDLEYLELHRQTLGACPHA